MGPRVLSSWRGLREHRHSCLPPLVISLTREPQILRRAQVRRALSIGTKHWTLLAHSGTSSSRQKRTFVALQPTLSHKRLGTPLVCPQCVRCRSRASVPPVEKGLRSFVRSRKEAHLSRLFRDRRRGSQGNGSWISSDASGGCTTKRFVNCGRKSVAGRTLGLGPDGSAENGSTSG